MGCSSKVWKTERDQAWGLELTRELDTGAATIRLTQSMPNRSCLHFLPVEPP